MYFFSDFWLGFEKWAFKLYAHLHVAKSLQVLLIKRAWKSYWVNVTKVFLVWTESRSVRTDQGWYSLTMVLNWWELIQIWLSLTFYGWMDRQTDRHAQTDGWTEEREEVGRKKNKPWMPYVQENVQLHYSFLFQICCLRQSKDPPNRQVQNKTKTNNLDSSLLMAC